MKIANTTRPKVKYMVTLPESAFDFQKAHTTAFESEAKRVCVSLRSKGLNVQIAELTRSDNSDGSRGEYLITSWITP
jgi:hypothetical protein